MFSILIPTWNNFNYLKVCIESILEHSQLEHEILVHVNGSDENTLKFLEEHRLKHTKSKDNIGVCKALNLLAQKATKDYYVYMNDDMYVLPKWDEVLMEVIYSKPNHMFYLSATMIEPKKGGHNCMISPHDYGDISNKFDLQKLIEEHAKLPFADWNGASWPPSLVHKDLWNKVGGYSEEFSPGLYSDPDFSMKLWQIGVRDFHGVSQSRVYHFQSKSLGRVKLNNGNKQFKKKWRVPASFFYSQYLKLGTRYVGPLPEISKGIRYQLAKLKTLFA
jgi:glycosyltransferase involved in cell wall biosynthesis